MRKLGINRCGKAYFGKLSAHITAFLAVFELCAYTLCDKRWADVFINSVHACKFLYKWKSGLFTYAGNARNIVARIAHKRLYFYHLFRSHAVLLHNNIGRVVNVAFCLGKPYGNVIIYKLERVTVTRWHCTGYLLIRTGGWNSSDYIIGFKALFFDNGYSHCGDYLFHIGELLCKVFGHTLAVCLIAVVHLMAECRCIKVESYRYHIRIYILFKHKQSVHKACYGICGNTSWICQHTDTVECTV